MRKQTIKILNTETGESKSLRKINKENKKEINTDYLTFSEVVLKRKLFTRTQLEKLIASGDVKELTVKNRRYISRESLYKYLEDKK